MAHRMGGLAAVATFLLAFGLAATRSAALCVTDTTTADFAAGALGACYAGDRAGGEVLLAPTEGTEFSGGPGLPAGWVFADWNPPDGTASVGGGALSVNSGRVNSDPVAYGPGRVLEFVATFGAQPFQHVGLGGGDNTIGTSGIYGHEARQWVMFSTKDTSSNVFARSNDGSTALDNSVATIDGLPHRYRIEWGASEINYFIDGTLVQTHSITIAGPMRPAISEYQVPAPLLEVNWIRMTPYASPCTYDSAVVDGGNNGADWTSLTAGTQLPGGTAVTIQTRSGNTLVPDMSWSGFQALSGGTTIQSPNARYLQYRVILSTGDSAVTPELEDAQVCFDACTVSGAEICDNIDNDCDGQIDEGTDGAPCNTGVPGACADSINVCNAGVLQCPQTVFPVGETCNNIDDDCDGSTDEGTGGAPCNSGVPGICAPSNQVCSGGTLQCPQTIFPGTETCNNLDDDCDGSTDEGTGGSPCMTGLLGVCAPGTNQCQSGSLVCVQNTSGGPEVCNNLDDDCDGSTDEGDPGGGGGCVTGTPGICSAGTLHCSGGSVVCQPNATPTTEVCNGLDDNCNGTTDEGTGGAACDTGQPGVCGPGTEACQAGTLNCIQTTAGSTELCETGQDEDCNGEVDEVGCACAMAETTISTTQTKINKVKLSDQPAKDKVLAKGTFTLPMAGLIDPATEVVRIRINDDTGLHYEGVIPAGSFTASPSGRTFKYSDKTLAHDGIKKAKFAIKGDGVTVKYLFKAQGLDQPTFTAGTGTATVVIGTRCFEDNADTCVASPSGASIKCR